jgi:hypothetical protein
MERAHRPLDPVWKMHTGSFKRLQMGTWQRATGEWRNKKKDAFFEKLNISIFPTGSKGR